MLWAVTKDLLGMSRLAHESCDPSALSASIIDDEQRCRSTTGVDTCVAGWRSSYCGSIRGRCRRISAHQQVHATSILHCKRGSSRMVANTPL